jgi:hypothetical protein
MIEYILDNYGQDLISMCFSYVGVISIILIFFPLSKIYGFLKEAVSVIISLFKR